MKRIKRGVAWVARRLARWSGEDLYASGYAAGSAGMPGPWDLDEYEDWEDHDDWDCCDAEE